MYQCAVMKRAGVIRRIGRSRSVTSSSVRRRFTPTRLWIFSTSFTPIPSCRYNYLDFFLNFFNLVFLLFFFIDWRIDELCADVTLHYTGLLRGAVVTDRTGHDDANDPAGSHLGAAGHLHSGLVSQGRRFGTRQDERSRGLFRPRRQKLLW